MVLTKADINLFLTVSAVSLPTGEPVQPALHEPAGAVGWTRQSPEAPSNPNHSGVL